MLVIYSPKHLPPSVQKPLGKEGTRERKDTAVLRALPFQSRASHRHRTWGKQNSVQCVHAGPQQGRQCAVSAFRATAGGSGRVAAGGPRPDTPTGNVSRISAWESAGAAVKCVQLSTSRPLLKDTKQNTGIS